MQLAKPQTTSPDPNAYMHFFQLAVQYYISGRFAATAPLMPVTGTHYHHAVEMILKGELSKSVSLDELKKYGHSLKKNWRKFKKLFSTEDLSPFDELLRELDRFERLRYPDAALREGMQLTISWSPPAGVKNGPAMSPPHYGLSVTELDEFVKRLFELCHVNPPAYIGYLHKPGRAALEYDNPTKSVWFPE